MAGEVSAPLTLSARFDGEILGDPTRRDELLGSLAKLAAEHGVELTPATQFDVISQSVSPEIHTHDRRGFTYEDFVAVVPTDNKDVRGTATRAHSAASKTARRLGVIVEETGVAEGEGRSFIPRDFIQELLDPESNASRKAHSLGTQSRDFYRHLLMHTAPAQKRRHSAAKTL